MFKFTMLKINHRKFLSYLAIVVLLWIVLNIFLFQNIITGRITAFNDQSRVAFDQSKKNLDDCISNIENYMTNLYSDSLLISDLMCFLGSSAEEYQNNRLTNNWQDERSFVDDLRAFAQKSGKVFLQISIHDTKSANVLYFEDSSIKHNISNNDENLNKSFDTGFLYTRNLVSNNGLLEIIGEIRFLIRYERIFIPFDSIPTHSLMFVKNNKDIIYAKAEESMFTSVEYLNKEAASSNRVVKKNQVVKFAFDSNTDVYIATKTWNIVKQNFNLIFMVFFALLVVFFFIMLMLSIVLREEEEFLKRITFSINSAKEGLFFPIDLNNSRHREYTYIAEEINDMLFKLEEYIRTEFKLKLKQKETELHALQHQINPHFLYNSLEIIRSMAIVEKDENVADALASLGKMYREIVKSDQIITMSKELELLVNYLEVMEFRSKNNFYYQINIEAAVREIKTIKFWMQPLAENFFKHGFDEKHNFNVFIITGREEENFYYIEMMDNGSGINFEQLNKINGELDKDTNISSSIGLKNVYSRLKMFYGSDFSMSIKNNEEAGVCIRIYIPKSKGE